MPRQSPARQMPWRWMGDLLFYSKKTDHKREAGISPHILWQGKGSKEARPADAQDYKDWKRTYWRDCQNGFGKQKNKEGTYNIHRKEDVIREQLELTGYFVILSNDSKDSEYIPYKGCGRKVIWQHKKWTWSWKIADPFGQSNGRADINRFYRTDNHVVYKKNNGRQKFIFIIFTK